jgi:hypothetical protein
MSFEKYLTRLRTYQASADIDEGGLASAVLSNHGESLTCVQRKIDMICNDYCAKSELQIFGLQEWCV